MIGALTGAMSTSEDRMDIWTVFLFRRLQIFQYVVQLHPFLLLIIGVTLVQFGPLNVGEMRLQ